MSPGRGGELVAVVGRRLLRLTVAPLLLARLALVEANPVVGDAVGWGLIGGTPERDNDIYFSMLRTDYKFRLRQDYMEYTIDILVNPCKELVRSGGKGENCCFETNRAGCQHHPTVSAGPDLQIAYFQNAHIPTCRGTMFDGDPNCGTYIEVHRPGDKRVLADVAIDLAPYPNGFRTTRIATHTLCLGDHELWWVVRTRSGPYVQRSRQFFVENPSCEGPPGSVPFVGQNVIEDGIP
mmetsp:Transcript_59834/g.135235  ORF Transcript_59834/g.135235 Transcript_59834/m.135235 type:complete len:237 (+) Transcript_59834:2-712(+)